MFDQRVNIVQIHHALDGFGLSRQGAIGMFVEEPFPVAMLVTIKLAYEIEVDQALFDLTFHSFGIYARMVHANI